MRQWTIKGNMDSYKNFFVETFTAVNYFEDLFFGRFLEDLVLPLHMAILEEAPGGVPRYGWDRYSLHPN